jgi:serine/threonine-protein kinase ATR
MSNDELRASAFSCWAAMIFSLDDDDVEVLIETTFFIINHYWSSFDDPTRERCRSVITFLLKQKRELLQALISKLPSLSHIHSLSDIEAKLSELRTPVDSRTALNLLAERISHENSGVVLQALRELTSYLQRQQQQEYIQASAVSEQPDSVVPNLTRALLDCSSRYAMDQSEISRLCTQSLGLIGCLDPNRVETVRSERQIVVENNFETAEETTDFVLVLLEDVLVKSFLSVTDTKLQGFLSYTMQELLDRCDVGAAIHMHGKQNSREKDIDRIYRKFRAMSEVAKEILTPFLTSRYRLQAMAQQQTEYPIFRPGKTYGVWMRNITLDLLRRPQTPFASLIFDPISRVIRLKDLSIAEFMFPFLVVHAVLGDQGSENVKEQVLWELQSVLKHELPKDASYAEREDQKLFYEVRIHYPLSEAPSNQARLSSAFLIMP